MDKDFLIQTTNSLYRLTLFFPKKEPLRYKMRELASDILAQVFNSKSFKKIEIESLSSMLEILNGFFEVAKQQNWVSLSDILMVQKTYINFGDELRSFSQSDSPQDCEERRKEKSVLFDFANARVTKKIEEKEITIQAPDLMSERNLTPRKQTNISERQKKILDFLNKKGNTQVHQIKEIFPKLTKRTLRRDFEQLLNQGLIKRIGERNEISYQIKSRT